MVWETPVTPPARRCRPASCPPPPPISTASPSSRRAAQRPTARRMLLIINPYATSMTPHIRTLVLYALQARYEVDAVDTQTRGHAIELCREAADEGYDVVVSLGGDGTVNEVANGLAGSSTPLTCLPGGATNVLCKMLGIPGDIVGATAHLLNLADAWRPFKIDLARVNGHHFTFSGGLGLDAAVVKSVDEQPARKTALRQWYFGYSAIRTFAEEYLNQPAAARGPRRRTGHERRLRGRAERQPVHVLQRPPAARRRPQPARQRHALAAPSCTAPRCWTCRRSSGGSSSARRSPATAGSPASPRRPTSASSAATAAPSRSRSTATGSGTSRRPTSASRRAASPIIA